MECTSKTQFHIGLEMYRQGLVGLIQLIYVSQILVQYIYCNKQTCAGYIPVVQNVLIYYSLDIGLFMDYSTRKRGEGEL